MLLLIMIASRVAASTRCARPLQLRVTRVLKGATFASASALVVRRAKLYTICCLTDESQLWLGIRYICQRWQTWERLLSMLVLALPFRIELLLERSS